MIIKVQDPKSAEVHELNAIPVDNIPEPGWSVTLADNSCVLLYLKDGAWGARPNDLIGHEFAQAIGYEINPSTKPHTESARYIFKSDKADKARRPRL